MVPERKSLIFLMPSLAGGGAERVSAILLPHLMEEFDLTLAMLENRRAYDIPVNLPVVPFSPPITGPIGHITSIPYHINALVNLVKKKKANVVLSFLEQANIINCFASRYTKHNAVISQRTEPRRQYRNKGILGRTILWASKKTYPMASQVISVSKGIRDIIIEDYKLDPERITVIPNPIDIDTLSAQSTEIPLVQLPSKFLVHVGRLQLAVKRQDFLLNAFAELSDIFPELQLVFVGEGPDRKELEKLISQLNLSDRVFLAGWQENVASIVRRSQAFVLSSSYEGWPNALVEAMALGCPVVATDCLTGPREILGNNEHGLLVSEDNPKALASAIRCLLEDKEKREHYSMQAKIRSLDFTLKKVGKLYTNVLHGYNA